tara:strand:+ start:830 stop:1543 length:714 start_codon:yes stop_codon:yes gene_type:complete
MKQFILLFTFFTIIGSIQAQEITGPELLEKAIKYHDPEGNWETFKEVLSITMKTPNKPERVSLIKIDLPNEYFQVNATQGKTTTKYTVDKGKCKILFNGKTPTNEEQKENKLSCERANMYKNYYTYLYGLPMKLKDDGAIIHKQVNLDKFKGEMYLVLKVTYEKEVGEDTWYFYFNPETYGLEIYQFFHDEEKNDGEFILLSGLETINGVKIPKKRDWYYNKNEQYLGTDLLLKNKN